MPTKLFVANLPKDVEQEDLYKLFSKYGKLREDGDGVALKKNREWFAFVEFEDAENAAEAIKNLDGYKISDRAIKVEEATGHRRARREDGDGERRCHICNRRGHLARDCSQDDRRGRSLWAMDKLLGCSLVVGKCYKCGRSGHKMSECNKRGGSRSSSSDRNRSKRKSSRRHRSPSYSRSNSRSRSRTPPKRTHKRASNGGRKDRKKSRSYSKSRSRSGKSSRSSFS